MSHTGQLGSIFASVELNETESQALVTTMRTGCRRWGWRVMSLWTLRSSEFDVWDDTRTRYEGRLEGWAADKGRSWRWLYAERKLERKEKRYSAIE